MQKKWSLARTACYRLLARRKPFLRMGSTEEQTRLVLTGFMLGWASLFTAIFPVCGFPIALTALLMGLYGRHTTALRNLSSWAIALSIVGLLLSFVNTIITISIYIARYVLQ